ncbi:hypothetical protein D9756_004343 [Leucocoprinus leucothites]|uniref:C2H2-type domain-containing protein n=1 Tax=Leucocoprinus leucothites TaxID=201217 RepID=A0A8H5D9T4_9AGAR|nr:hypothetical protein D9756_004343 [Leucoagaricus leucothites]
MPPTPTAKSRRSHPSTSRLSAKDESFLCTFCNKSFERKRDYNRHSKIHQDPALSKKYKCSELGCDYATRQRSNLRIHVKGHLGDKDQLCYWPAPENAGGICGFECTDPSSFNRHFKVHAKRAMIKKEAIPEYYVARKQRVLARMAKELTEEPSSLKASTSRKASQLSRHAEDIKSKPPPANPEPPFFPAASSSQGSIDFDTLISMNFPLQMMAPWVHDSVNEVTPESSGYATPSDIDMYGRFYTEEPHRDFCSRYQYGDITQGTSSLGIDHLNDWLQPHVPASTQVEHQTLQLPVSEYYPSADPWAEIRVLMQEPQSLACAPSMFSFDDVDRILSQKLTTDGTYTPTFHAHGAHWTV